MGIYSFNEVAGMAQGTFRRFPISLVSAAGAAYFAVAAVGRGAPDYKTVIMTMMLGIPVFAAARLVSESRPERTRLSWQGPLGAAIVLTAFFVSKESWGEMVFALRWVQYLLAAMIALWVLPGITNQEEGEVERWWRGARLFESVVTAFFVAAMVFIGCVAALGLLKVLFDIRVPNETYLRIWSLCALFLAPVLFLQGVPKPAEAPSRGESYPQRLGLIARYVLIPLTTIYVGLLLVYIAQIVIARSWPKGTLGYLIAGVASLGLLTRMALSPVAQSLEGVSALYHRWFPAAVVPLLVLQLMALWRRTEDYGWTENRAALGIFALWHLMVSIYALTRRGRDTWFTTTSLVVVLLASSLGPWSPYSIALRSQFSRLEKILTAAGALKDGKVTGKATWAVGNDLRQGREALNFFLMRNQHARIQPWFDTDITGKTSSQVAALLGGAELQSGDGNARRFNVGSRLGSKQHALIDVKGY